MKQEHALAMMKAGHNVFLTGQAGSGKTYCLNEYIRYLKRHGVAVAVTASTGIAATYINGTTIHSWSGIGIKDSLNREQLRRLSKRRGMQKKMDSVKVLVIDEISMLHRRQLAMVDEVMQYFKENDLPFGGVQVIFCGDFFQLPPVGKPGERPAEKFCFMAPVWIAAQLKICYLDEQHRQEQGALSLLLNAIRRQNITPVCREIIARTLAQAEQTPDYFPHLYPHNINADKINEAQLAALAGKAYQYESIESGETALAQGLARNILAPETLSLKIGAKVMFVKNNPEQQTFNGMTGEVAGFSSFEQLPVVRLSDGRNISVARESWSIEDEKGNILASVEQLPLRLAWAVTVHKSQGMTLEQASMDLSRTFEFGQGYVALSRLTSLEGLRLLGINERALEPEPLACKADIRFQALSAEAEQQFPLETLYGQWAAFITDSGGTTEAVAVSPENGEKIPTHLITKALWLQGYDAEDIMTARGLSEGTIYRHLEKLKTDPEMDFSRIPYDEVLAQRLAPLIAASGEMPALKTLFTALAGEYSYHEIRRALLFI